MNLFGLSVLVLLFALGASVLGYIGTRLVERLFGKEETPL